MRFTPTHEWISIEGHLATIGISDHAQKELGEIVYVELPKIGQIVQSGEEVCVLESTKAAADVYSPASGKVIAINELLRETPSLINRAAESSGWLYKLELS
jgi:Glycine cleavage system H protein (lipoate-binding)